MPVSTTGREGIPSRSSRAGKIFVSLCRTHYCTKCSRLLIESHFPTLARDRVSLTTAPRLVVIDCALVDFDVLNFLANPLFSHLLLFASASIDRHYSSESTTITILLRFSWVGHNGVSTRVYAASRSARIKFSHHEVDWRLDSRRDSSSTNGSCSVFGHRASSTLGLASESSCA